MHKRISNLDGLRFMAAWVVLLSHVEVFKTYFGVKTLGWRLFSNSAQIAVTFFFVLSGFLITWLLLKEKMKNSSDRISITGFYKKRILRIWPLYYLLVIATFFLLKNNSFFSIGRGQEMIQNHELVRNRLLGYLAFLPNYTEYKFGNDMYLGQTWSLGVEEFFYLFFPLALYFIRMKRILFFLLSLTLLFLFLSTVIHFVKTGIINNPALTGVLSIYLDKYRIYSFALGGLAAYGVLQGINTGSKYPEMFFHKKMAILLMIILVVCVAGGITFSLVTQQLYSIFFSAFLFSVISSKVQFRMLNHPVIVYLGKISYGIYMLHPVAIVCLFKLVNPGRINGQSFTGNLMLFTGATFITIVLAILSYELYEKFFLRLRTKRD